MFDALKSKFRWSEFTLKCIENLQCLIHLNDFVDLSTLRPLHTYSKRPQENLCKIKTLKTKRNQRDMNKKGDIARLVYDNCAQSEAP